MRKPKITSLLHDAFRIHRCATSCKICNFGNFPENFLVYQLSQNICTSEHLTTEDLGSWQSLSGLWLFLKFLVVIICSLENEFENKIAVGIKWINVNCMFCFNLKLTKREVMVTRLTDFLGIHFIYRKSGWQYFVLNSFVFLLRCICCILFILFLYIHKPSKYFY